MNSLFDLSGRVALVTGSSRGIGNALARALADSGATVVLNGINAERLKDAEAAMAAEYAPGRVHSCAFDVTSDSEAARGIAWVEENVGPLEILVNNAGIQHTAPVEEFPAERWDAVIAINLSAAFHAIRAALPQMKSRNWGRIVNIASAHGLVASAQKAAYVAAKHGLLGLTKVVALETARTDVTCNAICPGWVLTPLVQKQIDELASRDKLASEEAKMKLLAEKQPSLEFATPEQIGAAAVFLCSEAAAQIRGVALPVDGGWTAQ